MIKKSLLICLLLAISATLSSCKNEFGESIGTFFPQTPGWNTNSSSSGAMIMVAAQPESAADRLYSLSLSSIKQLNKFNTKDTQSCQSDGIAIITIYSTNSRAQSDIEVIIDGNFVGNLTTYFPDGAPVCKTPSTEGVITLMVPAGDHILEAASPNFIWSNHIFSTERCECTLIPLS